MTNYGTHALCRLAAGLAFLLIWTATVRAADPQSADSVVVVVGPNASSPEKIAAEELVGYLRRMYPRQPFRVGAALPPTGRCILLGTIKTNPALGRYVAAERVAARESFVVTVAREGTREIATIVGADPQGCVYGTYAILEKLGCGFYLSFDSVPEPKSQAFSFTGWELCDAPLAADRIVFNWHNFLSGCTGWNLADWQRWIAQSQKMRFNTIMVHAYGNNPMFTYAFNGRTKAVGYLTSTAKGRDWGTEHVNDVRRLVGGQVFAGPVFGSDAAIVPDEKRVDAVQSLMKQVFAAAAQRGMHVIFALDVDTPSSNPQELIRTLPESARFKAGSLWLAAPDVPDGYAYYKTQAETLLKLYPQIDRLAIWIRNGKTPWTELTLNELPPRWQAEFKSRVAKEPELAKLRDAPGRFALGKVIAAFQRALEELDRKDVRLLSGSWLFDWMRAADPFYPAGVPFLPLDYEVLHGKSELDTPERRAATRQLAARRPIIPIVWAHHDDGAYLGRSFTPFENFRSKLADSGGTSYGIIHWTTRPLDLYFKSLSQQVWSATKNRPLRATCDEMASRCFGAPAGGEYLHAWLTGAPAFSRETTDFFVDHALSNVAEVVAGCRQRLGLLDGLDTAKTAYWRGLEEFTEKFYQTESIYQQACEALRNDDFESFRAVVAACQPEAVIEQYVRTSSVGGIGQSERGSVVSINLRWLTYFLSLRQALALEPVRIKYGPTSHEPLAQGPGTLAFFVDADKHFWRCLGRKELGAEEIRLPSVTNELCRSGIGSSRPLTLRIQPFLSDTQRATPKKITTGHSSPTKLRPGLYRLRLFTIDATSTAEGQRVFDIAVDGAGDAAKGTDRVDIFQRSGGANRMVELVYPVTVGKSGTVTVTLTPVKGELILCGAVLQPMTQKTGPG